MEKKISKPIKILYIMPALDKGGAERFIVDLITHLDYDIYKPTLLLFKSGGAEEWIDELKAKGVPVIILKKEKKIDLKNFFNIYSNIKKIKPDIVHTQLGGDIYGRLAAKLLHVPVIISTEQNVNQDEKFFYNLLKKITNPYASKIVVISSAVKADLASRYGVLADKITLIPNGLNINKFLINETEAENKTGSSRITVGTIGRLNTQKGHDILIKASLKLQDRGFEFLIAGVGPLEQDLRRQIAVLNLSDSFKLVGPISDVPSFLKTLDIFVLPSRWEGQGLVLLEAGLNNLPIIASDIAGIKEIIDDSTGWLVPVGDADALSQKIQWLADNLHTAEVREKIMNLRNRIIANYDILKISAKYQDLYRDLLK